MPIPDYNRLDDALLWFLYRNGGADHALRPQQVYDPLADLFGLTRQERLQPMPSNPLEPLWKNRVRWSRQHLSKRGDLNPHIRGIWCLTARGIHRAASMPDSFDDSAGSLAHAADARSGRSSAAPSLPKSALHLDEKDHTLVEIITEQRVSAPVVTLFLQLVNGVGAAIRSWGDTPVFQTHATGVCGLCGNQMPFLALTLQPDCITALYYTGATRIAGILKGDWMSPGDRAGSEPYCIADEKDLKKAINFASSAYAIAALGAAKGDAAPASPVPVLETPSDDTESVLDILSVLPQTSSIAPRLARRSVSPPSPQEYVFDPDDLTI